MADGLDGVKKEVVVDVAKLLNIDTNSKTVDQLKSEIRSGRGASEIYRLVIQCLPGKSPVTPIPEEIVEKVANHFGIETDSKSKEELDSLVRDGRNREDIYEAVVSVLVRDYDPPKPPDMTFVRSPLFILFIVSLVVSSFIVGVVESPITLKWKRILILPPLVASVVTLLGSIVDAYIKRRLEIFIMGLIGNCLTGSAACLTFSFKYKSLEVMYDPSIPPVCQVVLGLVGFGLALPVTFLAFTTRSELNANNLAENFFIAPFKQHNFVRIFFCILALMTLVSAISIALYSAFKGNNLVLISIVFTSFFVIAIFIFGLELLSRIYPLAENPNEQSVA